MATIQRATNPSTQLPTIPSLQSKIPVANPQKSKAESARLRPPPRFMCAVSPRQTVAAGAARGGKTRAKSRQNRPFVLDCNNSSANGLIPTYNGLLDRYLSGYFERPRMRHHLVLMRIVTILYSEYRLTREASWSKEHGADWTRRTPSL